jgi:RNA polymerase sigma-70 factor (ECF subfamily)
VSLTTVDVWEAFAHHLRSYILRRIPDPVEAEDVLQEVFLRVHTHLPGLRQPDRLLPWLYRLARSAVVDHVRARRPAVELDEDFPADELPGDDPGAQIARGLGHMVDGLPAIYSEAVRLSELEGLDHKEVARRLGLSLSGAKSRVQRGRQQMYRQLTDCCSFELDRRNHIVDYQPRVTCCIED